ncbi:MAG TPA: 2,3-bisphosphoglycerate-independent phosphoglycerate mutase [Clostridiales bacterium]|jgi:2,3-bisphosphoglycerate-independent phosphoglycerate mutase|nr:2,3-bisphosphoglycerate-independent phosphoglycerate mutase [Clostridiales bacterium]HPV00852.1 2,3-bisphosphoglycerate-independent phosphoglycerate mutase [Clostridiales bacterium]
MNKTVVLVVMDGIGKGSGGCGDAVSMANTPTLDMLLRNYPNIYIKAHGTAVGLPSDDDMGNSEVGHNALGCGQVYSQGAKLVNESIERGDIYRSDSWHEIISNCIRNGSTLHFIGLLSDGNVHSNINHLKSMIVQAKKDGVGKVRVHALLDGRDVPSLSATTYVNDLEAFLAGLNDGGFDAMIASGGGRMAVTMDRYQADWDMVRRGWETHVLGEGRRFASAAEAITTYREELDVTDQYLPPFIVEKDGQPAGRIVDGDSVVLFNFRGDRSIELSMAFEYEDFDKFDRRYVPKVVFAGMLQYDGDLLLPKRYLVSPPNIRNTLSELLVENGIKQFAVSETQKYGHMTYFWNGNRSGKFSDELETYCEIPSDMAPFDERPWMKSAEITDQVIEAIRSGEYGFIRCNYPNGDMVGHTGNLDAAVIAVEAVDLGLARILKATEEHNVVLIVTADHGNADDMILADPSGKTQPKTAHSLNPVPFIIYDRHTTYRLRQGNFGLANVAPTIAQILGLDIPGMWEESMLDTY